MKKLLLKNAIGNTYDLMDSAVMTFQLDGLGFSDESVYVRAGRNYVLTERVMEQRELSLTVLFYQNADVEYKEFIIFIRKSPLTIIYQNDSGEYRVSCDVRTISKTDRKGYSVYGCSMTLLCLTDFYRVVSVYNSGDVLGGKTYDYTYNYQYSDGVAESIKIESETTENSPCKIMIYGPCENPSWRHYVNGELIATGAMNGDIPSNRILVIDSTTVPFSITEQDSLGNLTADRYQACDFGTERFFFLQNGSNTISVSHSGSDICPLKVEANISYASV